MKQKDPMEKYREAHRESYARKLWVIDHSGTQMVMSILVSMLGTALTLYIMHAL